MSGTIFWFCIAWCGRCSGRRPPLHRPAFGQGAVLFFVRVHMEKRKMSLLRNTPEFPVHQTCPFLLPAFYKIYEKHMRATINGICGGIFATAHTKSRSLLHLCFGWKKRILIRFHRCESEQKYGWASMSLCKNAPPWTPRIKWLVLHLCLGRKSCFFITYL